MSPVAPERSATSPKRQKTSPAVGSRHQSCRALSQRYEQGALSEGYSDQDVVNRYQQVAPQLRQDQYVQAAEQTFNRVVQAGAFRFHLKHLSRIATLFMECLWHSGQTCSSACSSACPA